MWRDPSPDEPLPFLETLWEDAVRNIPLAERPTTPGAKAKHFLRCLGHAGFRCGLTYRLSYSSRAKLGRAGRVVSGALFWWNRHYYNCTITPTARIHGGLNLPHPTGISIGPGVVIGPDVWIFQNVVIAGSPTKTGMPTLGENVAVFSGAVITGPVKVGDRAWIGANAVVARDLEEEVLLRAPDGQKVPLAILGLAPKRNGENGVAVSPERHD